MDFDSESESDEFSLDDDRAIANETDWKNISDNHIESQNFLEELVDDNQSSLEEFNWEEDIAESESDETIEQLNSNGTNIEFEEEITSNSESFIFDETDNQFNEIDSLEGVDRKLDEITKISDESLGEISELLDSVEKQELEEDPELNRIHQENQINN